MHPKARVGPTAVAYNNLIVLEQAHPDTQRLWVMIDDPHTSGLYHAHPRFRIPVAKPLLCVLHQARFDTRFFRRSTKRL